MVELINYYDLPNAFNNIESQTGGNRVVNVYSDRIESTSNGSGAGSYNLAAIYLPVTEEPGIFCVEVTYASGYASEDAKPTIGYVTDNYGPYPYNYIQNKVSCYPAGKYVSQLPSGVRPVIYLGNASTIKFGKIYFISGMEF